MFEEVTENSRPGLSPARAAVQRRCDA